MKANLRDTVLHTLSLQVAVVYKSLYNESLEVDDPELNMVCDDLLLSYRGIRRGIRKDQETNKRFGSAEADAILRS